jgi:NTE family protein
LSFAACDIGPFRGNHYAALTAGDHRRVSRLPNPLGGSVFAGGWVENGSVFNALDTAKWRTDVNVGAVLDSLIGPVIVGTSVSIDGHRRYYVGIGRVF